MFHRNNQNQLDGELESLIEQAKGPNHFLLLYGFLIRPTKYFVSAFSTSNDNLMTLWKTIMQYNKIRQFYYKQRKLKYYIFPYKQGPSLNLGRAVAY